MEIIALASDNSCWRGLEYYKTINYKEKIMKKIKLVVVGLALIVVMMLSGCDIVNNGPKMGKNPVYESAEKEVAFLLDAIEKKDAQAIKNKFSPYAKSHIDDLDTKIDTFIQEFPGYGSDVRISDTFERRNNYSKVTYIMTPSFDYTVNGQGYCLRIVYYTESDEDESKVGWYSLQIFEYPNRDYSKKFYMHGSNDDPDILLWDYTKDQ